MAQKAIREYDGKAIFAKHWNEYFDGFHYDFARTSCVKKLKNTDLSG